MTADGKRDASFPRFSLVRGGLIYLLERRAGLIGEERLGIRKRILLFWCVTWLPIVLLELGRMVSARTSHIPHPLLTSGMGVNMRLLFSSAILIGAESLVETRVGMVVSQFVKRGIIKNAHELQAILSEAEEEISGRLGIEADIAVLALVFLGAYVGVHTKNVGPFQDWRAIAPETGIPAAVSWYLWVSLPLLYFLPLRWGWRFLVWVQALWKISKLNLKLNTSHPDLAGGIAFISLAQEAFALVWLAVSSSAAITVAYRVKVLGAPLRAFLAPIGLLVAVETLVLLAPLLLFVRTMIIAKYEGLFRYGALSSEYVMSFDRKWIDGPRPSPEKEVLLGSSDIEQWANIGIGLERSEKMRPFPASPSTFILILVAGILPFLPLAFMAFPAEQVLRAVLKLFL